MAHSRTNFSLPQFKIASNDSELKGLQQKTLLNHYNQYMKEKQSKNPYLHNPELQDQTNKYLKYDRVKKQYDQIIKSELIDNYKSQLERKEQLKRQERQQRIKEDERVLEHSQKIKEQEMQRMRRMEHQFKRDAMNLVAEKQLQKKQIKRRQKEEKQLYQHRYSLNTLSMQKKSLLHEHYENVNSKRDQVEQNYRKNVEPYNKKVQERKQRIVDRGQHDKQIRLRYELEKQSLNALANKNQLKQMLLQQIREKEEKKKHDIQKQKSIGYTSAMYNSMHHPINNPVDFRMTHDNKYIINQIGTQSNLSGLAKSGSQSILS